MALPPLDTLCDALQTFPEALRIRMPGGAVLEGQLAGLPPSLFQMAKGLLGQANSALAPLDPIFTIIETINAIHECVKAIPDALGPPPDPGKLVGCLPELAKRIEELLALLPPISVFATIADLLDAVIMLLQGIIQELVSIQRYLLRITAARALSARVPGLLTVIGCGEATAAASMDNLTRALGSVAAILNLMNTLTGLAGLPQVPTFTGGLNADPADAIGGLQALVDVLSDFRATIPIS